MSIFVLDIDYRESQLKFQNEAALIGRNGKMTNALQFKADLS